MFYVYAAIILIMNVTAFILMWVDKRRARHREKRISERMLFIVTGFFGGLGGCLAMYVFHHKTRHIRFAVGFPMLFLLQIYIILMLIDKRVIRLPF
ncbi:MAG: DUF1294 domain-containing protein [Oscillospiraceae bacterium]|nr:DUF1294 domain-containing protein [Oscillospiraceae bacterium]